MKSVKIDLSNELDTLQIHTFADFHIGDRGCDIEFVRSKIDVVKNVPNAYCILNGDIVNNATKTSVSDCYAEELSPMEQMETCISLFEPIKDKILCITSGNHERRTYNKEGIDITALVAKQLSISDKYCCEGGIVFLRFGTKLHNSHENQKMCYTIYATHGSGGGRKEGSKIIRLADMASIIDADIYIHSHTHLPMIMKQAFYRIDKYNSTFNCVDKLFVNTSASMDYGGYGQLFEFKPNSKECPIIYLNGSKKEFTAKL